VQGGLHSSPIMTWRQQRDKGAKAALAAPAGRPKTGPRTRTSRGLAAKVAQLEGESGKARTVIEVRGTLRSAGSARPAATPHASSFFPLRGYLPVLFLGGAPFSAAAFSAASRISGSVIIPAAS
jgi:hypothetical protein